MTKKGHFSAFNLNNIRKNLRQDILSGFVVSLIALPLCLGVASASNFPPIAGVLTSIIGGLVIGIISGSELAIKGPAAGLIVIVAGAVDEYSRGNMQQGYILTASLIAVTGFAQIILGILKIGKWSDFIPSSVVHGMLAAIGVIIISKQIHLLVGIAPSDLKGLAPLDLIKKVPESLWRLDWKISTIGVSCLLLLFLLPRITNLLIKAIPPFLIVIIFSILIVQVFYFFNAGDSFYNALINPGELSFSPAFDGRIFSSVHLSTTTKYFILLTVIGTIESILTVKAVDILDPYKRTSDSNKDVIAIGFGNLLSGMLGGLPMISEVARSSANINNKGVTRISSIMHGLFLMIFMMIFVAVIKLIPVAALSSILIYVGYKLANPGIFARAFRVSNEHFLVFIATTLITIASDLLIGVLSGMILKTLINLTRSKQPGKLFKIDATVEVDDKQAIIYLDSVAVFTNWLATKRILSALAGKKIIVDFSNVLMVDSAFIDSIGRYRDNYEGEFILRGFQELRPLKNHPHSMRVKSLQGEFLTIQLSPHQQKLKAYCEQYNYIVSFGSVIPPNYLETFRFFRHSDIRQTSIYVNGTSQGIKFEYFECLVYEPVDMIEYHANVLGIDTGEYSLPKFMIQKESKLDTVLEIFLKNQVIFENNPEFNSKYSVYSREKARMQEILTAEISTFLLQKDLGDHVIESNGANKFIIHNSTKSHEAHDFQYKLDLATVIGRQITKATKSKKVEQII